MENLKRQIFVMSHMKYIYNIERDSRKTGQKGRNTGIRNLTVYREGLKPGETVILKNMDGCPLKVETVPFITGKQVLRN